MILVYDHKMNFVSGANEEFSQILCSLLHLLQKSVRLKYKTYRKTIAFLHLSDDKKVSESSAQTPAHKFYLMQCWIRSLSRAALQLDKSISESCDEKGRLSLQPSLSTLSGFSQPFYTRITLYCDSVCKFPVLFSLGHAIWIRSLSLYGDIKSVKSGSVSLY